ncbi:hypothetical protein CB1_000243052 [Camelus ferus]|nr:hypothetical protein CB1_000243052 [Camelus ferus]
MEVKKGVGGPPSCVTRPGDKLSATLSGDESGPRIEAAEWQWRWCQKLASERLNSPALRAELFRDDVHSMGWEGGCSQMENTQQITHLPTCSNLLSWPKGLARNECAFGGASEAAQGPFGGASLPDPDGSQPLRQEHRGTRRSAPPPDIEVKARIPRPARPFHGPGPTLERAALRHGISPRRELLTEQLRAVSGPELPQALHFREKTPHFLHTHPSCRFPYCEDLSSVRTYGPCTCKIFTTLIKSKEAQADPATLGAVTGQSRCDFLCLAVPAAVTRWLLIRRNHADGGDIHGVWILPWLPGCTMTQRSSLLGAGLELPAQTGHKTPLSLLALLVPSRQPSSPAPPAPDIPAGAVIAYWSPPALSTSALTAWKTNRNSSFKGPERSYTALNGPSLSASGCLVIPGTAPVME